jgi:hypothetical protein
MLESHEAREARAADARRRERQSVDWTAPAQGAAVAAQRDRGEAAAARDVARTEQQQRGREDGRVRGRGRR